MRPSAHRLREVFNLVEKHIEDKYGIPVVITDVPSPFTGDLDGAEIHVDHNENLESAVFIIAHLFGHTVQWNVSAEAREIGSRIYENPSDELMQQLHEYEKEACRLSIQLFHEAGVTDLDQWLSDFSACDFAYLSNFYKTGKKPPFKSFWKDGQELLEPVAIPDFTPTKWMSRWDGIVV
jgi:hypothetical protein